jgi:hypothetical protein
MSRRINHIVQLVLACIFLFVVAVSGLAAEVRRVPSKNLVEQGFLALTLDAEGAEDFRYTGMENQQHIYRGKIKPGAKIKLTMQATLAKQSSLPLTGRTCTARMEVTAKKGGEVIKKNSFKSDNKSNVFVNYTVPEGADTLEVNETFVLQNHSKEEKFNQKCTTKNKLILSTTDDPAVTAKTDSKTENGDKKIDGNTSKNSQDDKKTDGGVAEKKNDGDKKSDTETGKTDAGDAKESKGPGKGMIAGAVAAVAAIAGGGYFFMKKRKEDQAANEEIARKEKLRQQAIQRQQELQQHNLQQRQEEIDRQNRVPEAERLQEKEEQQQEQEPQQSMQQNLTVQEQHAMTQQAGAAGVAATMNNAEVVQKQPSFCTNCGAPLKPGTRFCENCGAKV